MSSPDGQPEVTVASTTSLRSGGRRAAPDFAEVGSSALATPLRSGCTKAAARPVGSSSPMKVDACSLIGAARGIRVLADLEHRGACSCGVRVPTGRCSRRSARAPLRSAGAFGPRRPRLTASVGTG
jgi:hypothetical protein